MTDIVAVDGDVIVAVIESTEVTRDFLLVDGSTEAIISETPAETDFILIDSQGPTMVATMEDGTEFLLITPGGPPGRDGLDAETSFDLAMFTHVQAPAPHPAYDDLPDLTLLFLNGLA